MISKKHQLQSISIVGEKSFLCFVPKIIAKSGLQSNVELPSE